MIERVPHSVRNDGLETPLGGKQWLGEGLEGLLVPVKLGQVSDGGHGGVRVRGKLTNGAVPDHFTQAWQATHRARVPVRSLVQTRASSLHLEKR
jgi:hypothetical protein